MSEPSDLPTFAALPAPPDESYPNPPLLDYSGIPPEALDDEQRIACELPCRHCGYNLQTIHSRANCPECGTAAHWSLIGDLLRFADADWVKTLGRGVLLILLSIAISFLAFFAVGMIDAILDDLILTSALFIMISVGSMLVAAYGEWLLTTPEPQPEGLPTPPAGLRGTARWLLMIGAATGLITMLIQSILLFTSEVPTAVSPMDTAMQGFDLISSLTGIVGMFCLAALMRRLALRAPHDGIARQTKIVAWAWGITLGLFCAGFLLLVSIQAFSPNSNTGLWDDSIFTTVLGCGGGTMVLVLAIWSLVLLTRYHSLFKRHAGYARFRIPAKPVARLDSSNSPSAASRQ